MRPWCSAMSGSMNSWRCALSAGERAVLVALHEGRVADHVRRQDGGQPPLDPRCRHGLPSTGAVAQPACSPHRRQRVIPAPDLLDDGVRVGGPHERPRVPVVLVDEAVDRLLQRDQRGEAATPQPPPGQLGEEGLDRVQPRARGRGEVEGPARMPLQPGHDLRVLVGAVVVQDRVHQLAGRDRGLDRVQEADELLVPVPLHAPAQHRAVQHVERREQRGGAVAFVVVGRGRRLRSTAAEGRDGGLEA